MKGYIKLSDAVELHNGTDATLYYKSFMLGDRQVIKYVTESHKDESILKWKSKVDFKELTDEQRYEILDYTLGKGSYHADEIVNYLDLFLHGKHIREIL